MEIKATIFFFPICGYCNAVGDCDWCEGTGFDPLPEHEQASASPQATDEEAFIAYSWPPPAEQPEDPGSGVWRVDGKGRIKHIAAA